MIAPGIEATGNNRRSRRDSRFHDSAAQSAIASKSRLGRVLHQVRRGFVCAAGNPVTVTDLLTPASILARPNMSPGIIGRLGGR